LVLATSRHSPNNSTSRLGSLTFCGPNTTTTLFFVKAVPWEWKPGSTLQPGVAQLLDYLGIGVGEGGCRQVGDAHLTAKRRFPLVITRRMPEERFDNPQFEARDDLVCGIDDLRPR
jgi:hypothetical protein